jgi:sugar O-acyltransferase (sialic acid O-acetyltransferase NeuD family)
MDVMSRIGYSLSLRGMPHVKHIIPDTRILTEGDWDILVAQCNRFVLAIGQIHTPDDRISAIREVTNRGGEFISIASPTAYIARTIELGKGAYIGHHAVINAWAAIGDYPILNTSCVIEHQAKVGNYCHISTGAVINGQASVGNRCFMGSNSVILQQINICDDVLVGAGSVVIADITEPGVYVGNPARKIR